MRGSACQPAEVPDLELVVAMVFGDGARFSIGLPTPDPEGLIPVIGAR